METVKRAAIENRRVKMMGRRGVFVPLRPTTSPQP